METKLDATRFRWSECPVDEPLELVRRRHFAGTHCMLSLFELRKGCDVPKHAHPNEQFAFVLEGRVEFEVGEEAKLFVLGPGEVLHLPPGVRRGARATVDSVVLDVFSPPSEETGVDVG